MSYEFKAIVSMTGVTDSIAKTIAKGAVACFGLYIAGDAFETYHKSKRVLINRELQQELAREKTRRVELNKALQQELAREETRRVEIKYKKPAIFRKLGW